MAQCKVAMRGLGRFLPLFTGLLVIIAGAGRTNCIVALAASTVILADLPWLNGICPLRFARG
jgi:hypothetical protein